MAAPKRDPTLMKISQIRIPLSSPVFGGRTEGLLFGDVLLIDVVSVSVRACSISGNNCVVGINIGIGSVGNMGSMGIGTIGVGLEGVGISGPVSGMYVFTNSGGISW